MTLIYDIQMYVYNFCNLLTIKQKLCRLAGQHLIYSFLSGKAVLSTDTYPAPPGGGAAPPVGQPRGLIPAPAAEGFQCCRGGRICSWVQGPHTPEKKVGCLGHW